MARKLNQQSLDICHLYAQEMNTYGDNGNIIALQKRCQWRTIQTTVTEVGIGQELAPDKFDLYFFGGGQDKAQEAVSADLKKKEKKLKSAVENGAVMLSICGGYQLLQKYFKTKDDVKIPGIGIFDAYTQASNDRMIGNLLIETNSNDQLIGFENHSGKTYLGKNTKPLGKVIKGFGNNGQDRTEGSIYKNAIGCYMHGSLLPKNPAFTDQLISEALKRKYKKAKLAPLDDSIELQAHDSAVNITRSRS